MFKSLSSSRTSWLVLILQSYHWTISSSTTGPSPVLPRDHLQFYHWNISSSTPLIFSSSWCSVFSLADPFLRYFHVTMWCITNKKFNLVIRFLKIFRFRRYLSINISSCVLLKLGFSSFMSLHTVITFLNFGKVAWILKLGKGIVQIGFGVWRTFENILRDLRVSRGVDVGGGTKVLRNVVNNLQSTECYAPENFNL
jgi:hypothetical protein